jgi:Cu(I)/Ag(I) efflux system membrane fusion protein
VPDPHAPRPLLVPTTAPLRAGRRDVVYVATANPEGGQRFEVRDVVLGPQTDAGFIVRAGLVEGEQVVREGAFKIDAELQLRGGDGVMTAHGGATPEAPTSMPAHADHADHADHKPADHEPAARKRTPRDPEPTSPTADDRPQTSENKNKTTEPEIKPEARPEAPPASSAPALAAAVRAYLALQTHLAADDAGAAAQAWTRLTGALETALRDRPDLAPHGAALKDAMRGRPSNLADHRKGFQRITRALVAALRQTPTLGAAPLTLFHCPMAFEGTGADWLQAAGSKLANPYFGASMLRCGDARGSLGP